jgi:glycosyltransferase involved in cell wall biosynthesis
MITEKAKKNNIEGKVHCVGYQKNPYPYIKYADCFVLSSRWEGLPNVLIEALHLGTPVAAFRCIPIIERIIDNRGNGFTAEKENVTSLAQAMSKSVDLGRIHSSYKSSQIEDFTKLFIE